MPGDFDLHGMFQNRHVNISEPEHPDDRRARIAREDRIEREAQFRDRILFLVLIASYCLCFFLGIFLLFKADFSVDSSQGKLGWLLLTNLLAVFVSALAGFKVAQRIK